jgi:DNA-binding transcriptional regulator YiaG
MLDHDCYEEGCGAPLSMRPYTKRTKVGRYKVDDSSCAVPVCANGHRELALDAVNEYERRAAIAVLREAGEIGGEEIRFARRVVGLTQTELAKRLDVRQETVSRWENGHEAISRVSRLALLAVVIDAHALDRLDAGPAPVAEILKVRERAA